MEAFAVFMTIIMFVGLYMIVGLIVMSISDLDYEYDFSTATIVLFWPVVIIFALIIDLIKMLKKILGIFK